MLGDRHPGTTCDDLNCMIAGEDTRMSCLSAIISRANERAHRLTAFDLKLVQFMGIFIGFILVKLIPELTGISVWWFVVLFVMSAIRPAYVFFKSA